MKVKNVGVVGCGAMGSSIAQVCAQAGYPVIVSEIDKELLDKGLASIDSFLTNGVNKGKISLKEKEATLGRIKGITNLQDFEDCDIVIEAIVEDINLKKKLFAELDEICPEKTILTTNTSTLCVIEIGSDTRRMDRVAGMHFYNPAQLMKLLEIVKTIETSDETIETCREFGISLGKTVIVAKDIPGFIGTRLVNPMILNAMRMLEAGIASRDDIDNAAKLGYGFPMGPLELADLIGLDVLMNTGNSRYEELKDPWFAPPPIMKRMILAGRLGRKAGKGFYDYK